MSLLIKECLCGILEIVYIDGNNERFLNICKNNGIKLWYATNKNNTLKAYIKKNEFYKLKPIRRKCGGKIIILKRKGLIFIWPKIKNRYGFFIGFIAMMVIIKIFSVTLLSIHIYGNTRYSDKEIIDFLSRNNVEVGKNITAISMYSIENEIRKNYKDIAFVSAEKNGTRININIKENLNNSFDEITKNELNKIDSESNCCYSDIISDIDGNVYSIITRSGVPLVKKGMEIHKGDTLVTGLITIPDDYEENFKYSYVEADADIYVITSISYYDYIDNYENMDTLLIEEIANNNLNEYLEKMVQKGIQIIENNVTIEVNNSGYKAEGEIKILKSIGIKAYKNQEDLRGITNECN